jgi:hypothetical protein
MKASSFVECFWVSPRLDFSYVPLTVHDFEADDQPGIICYLCFWYVQVMIFRTRLISGTNPLRELLEWLFSLLPLQWLGKWIMGHASLWLTFSAFGGLIATGVGFLSGKANLYGWQWLSVCWSFLQDVGLTE